MDQNTIDNDATMGGDSATLLAGRYRVVRQLGQGGMGSVWLAEDTQLDNRQVAIKMLPSILVSNKRAYSQLKAEALVSLKLTHPNIATVRAFEENNGNPFLVVDYIDGQTLDDYLAENADRVENAGRADSMSPPFDDGRAGAPRTPQPNGLPEADVIRLLTPIADALDYAHGEGVVHRDVKPGNVMIRTDGHPFILDFGIAREIQETMTRVTGKLSSGTLMYMSPEQLHGAAPKSSQDVYSFAAMAYECLMGTPPFSRGQIEYQIEHDSPAPLDPRIAICGSVMAGLAKRSEDRPVNCAGVLRLDDSRKPLIQSISSSSTNRASHIGHTATSSEKLHAGAERTLTLPCGEKIRFVWCPPGEFMMGSPLDELVRGRDEMKHRVRLTKGFWIGKYAITQKQWQSVMGGCPSYFSEVVYSPTWFRRLFKGERTRRIPLEKRPVESVSWNDCRNFCHTAGLGLRLPTEAEWEYACRAGTQEALQGLNSPDGLLTGIMNRGFQPYDVGRRCNNWGIFDMLGNICEWCEDLYGAYSGDVIDPQGATSGSRRVYRGGNSFLVGSGRCRPARRFSLSPNRSNRFLGFRVCCSAGII